MTETLDLTRDEALIVLTWLVWYPDDAVQLDENRALEERLVAYLKNAEQAQP